MKISNNRNSKELEQLREREKTLLNQKRNLEKELRLIKEEIDEIILEIADLEEGEFQQKIRRMRKEKVSQKGIREERREPIEENMLNNSLKRKIEGKELNEQQERENKRQKRQIEKEKQIKEIIEEEFREEIREELTETNKEIENSERNLLEKGIKLYNLAIFRAEKTMKTWLKYAKWFEEEIKR